MSKCEMLDSKYISESDTSLELYKYSDGRISLCIEVPDPNPRGLGDGSTVEIPLDELTMRIVVDFINKHLPKEQP